MPHTAGSDGIVVPPIAEGDGRFADNIVYFGRILRRSGLKIGPGAITDAIEAVSAIGIGSREEFYTALSCNFVKRHEDKPVFDEAFRIFWRPRDFEGKLIQMLSRMTPDAGQKDKPKAAAARVADSSMRNGRRVSAKSRRSRSTRASRSPNGRSCARRTSRR